MIEKKSSPVHIANYCYTLCNKGQLILVAIFLGFKSPKEQTKNLEGFLSLPLKHTVQG